MTITVDRPVIADEVTTELNPYLLARDYLDEHGWCRRTMKDRFGRVCLVGALTQATAGNPVYWQGWVVRRAIITVDPEWAADHPSIHMESWNDHLHRRGGKEKVREVLEVAAEMWEAERG